MGFVSKIKARLELRKLEKKYTTRRRAGPSSPVAEYVDGEYIYQIPSVHPPQADPQTPQLTSSSATFAASQQHRPISPIVSFPSSAPWANPHHSSSSLHTHNPSHSRNSFSATFLPAINTKHSSWRSSRSPSTGASNHSVRNSSLESPVSLSRNSKGQSWEPPKPGWGSDGTDAFRVDRKEFRFDVERDRQSVGWVE